MRFSLGMSTPARRAIAVPSVLRRSCTLSSGWTGTSLRTRGSTSLPKGRRCEKVPCYLCRWGICSALALLVARVDADHHDAAVTTDHAAVFADPLHTRADLHGFPLLVPLLITVRNASTSQIVRAHFEHHAILREDADVILPQDRVVLEMSPYDLNRGRITYRYK